MVIPTAQGLFKARVVPGERVIAVQRHAAGHRTPPHRVPYRTLALGLKQLGVKHVFATAAVGSLRTDWQIGTLAVCTDMIDWSPRQVTHFDRTVYHQPMDQPFAGAGALAAACDQQGQEYQREAIYVNVDGPRYETAAEIAAMGKLSGDVVGMTAGSEAIACQELGLNYACLAIVTNLGTGLSSAAIDHSGVTDVMKSRGEQVLEILRAAVRQVS